MLEISLEFTEIEKILEDNDLMDTTSKEDLKYVALGFMLASEGRTEQDVSDNLNIGITIEEMKCELEEVKNLIQNIRKLDEGAKGKLWLIVSGMLIASNNYTIIKNKLRKGDN